MDSGLDSRLADFYLGPLYEKRRKWVDLTRENKFEEGILNLLSELYPDEAHFIYELLQNAEDAQATSIKFVLDEHQLIVIHNGKLLFNYEDVESITSIGQSSKRDDINQIGKFGVGFKAVFAYTQTPRIYSDYFNFEIQDLVCPIKIDTIVKDEKETVFIFPFNSHIKTKTTCYNEISDFFKNITHDIILFLNNIESIEWSLSGDSSGRIKRTNEDKLDPDLISIEIEDLTIKRISQKHWFFRFTKLMHQYDLLQCGIAIKLQLINEFKSDIDTDVPLSQQLQVDPLQHGKLFVFFPTTKEVTGLKFHINGPYASTIDRASIRHSDQDNISILENTVELFLNKYDALIEKGFVTSKFLELLPNEDDEIPPFYERFRTQIFKDMELMDWIPTSSGDYRSSAYMVRGTKAFTDFFSDQDLYFISDEEYEYWALPVRKNSRAEKFLSSLHIKSWGVDELFWSIREKFYSFTYNSQKNTKWLLDKGIEWLSSFYVFLWSVKKSDLPYWFRYAEIIVTEENTLAAGYQLYFPTDDHKSKQNLKIVNSEIFQNLQPQSLKLVQDFLSATSVKHIGIIEEIEDIINRYYQGDELLVSKTEHLEHFEKFISVLEQHDSRSYSLKNKQIFLCNDQQLRSAQECYLDEPFVKSRFSIFENNLDLKPLWSGYRKLKGFNKFAKSLGVSFELKIIKTSIPGNHPNSAYLFQDYNERRSNHTINTDYTINKLDLILKEPSVEKARLIWKTMSKADSRFFEAMFRPNKQFPIRSSASTLIHYLRNRSWLPDKLGSFLAPRLLTEDSLHDGFTYKNDNGWLTAIKFGEVHKQRSEEYKAKIKKAEEIGISLEDAEFIREYRVAFEKFKDEQKTIKISSKFPSNPSKNPERRKEKTTARMKDAPEKNFETKSRSVKTSTTKLNPSEWLKTRYTNEDGQMFCQLCQNDLVSVSFLKRNSEYYFEAVEVFNSEILSFELEAQYLALCPLCSAKYKEYVKRDPETQKFLLKAIKTTDGEEFPLKIDNQTVKLRFVQTHLIDLVAALQKKSSLS